MRKISLLVLISLVLTFGLAQAQDAEQTKQKTKEQAKVTEENIDIKQILDVINLPKKAKEARDAGISEDDVRQVMEESRKHGLSPEETGIILRESKNAVRENGQVDGFGTFVQERLDEGLRGRELSDAIKEEHKLRGKGKGQQNKNKHQKQNMKQKMNNDEETGQNLKKKQGSDKDPKGQKGGKSNGKNK